MTFPMWSSFKKTKTVVIDGAFKAAGTNSLFKINQNVKGEPFLRVIISIFGQFVTF